MVKKYKVIKEYPGSPKIGTIHSWPKEKSSIEWLGTIVYNAYPEFWEEVKDYEIMSFRHDGVIFNYKPKEDKYLWRNNASNWSWSSIPDDTEILSVKRLSDGDVFTVGDTVKHKKGAKFIIKCIRIYEGNLQLTSGLGIVASIGDIEHFKEPLFITEDGVEVFEGDIVHFVNDTFGRGQWPVQKNSKLSEVYSKLFSSEKAAKKWIDENKPMYSKKQIEDMLIPYCIISLLINPFNELNDD